MNPDDYIFKKNDWLKDFIKEESALVYESKYLDHIEKNYKDFWDLHKKEINKYDPWHEDDGADAGLYWDDDVKDDSTQQSQCKPDVGHLVKFKEFHDSDLVGTIGIVVDKRGLEIQVMMSDSQMVWINRTMVEVINEECH